MRHRLFCFLTGVLALCAASAMARGSSVSTEWRIEGDRSGLKLEFSSVGSSATELQLRWARPRGGAEPDATPGPMEPVVGIRSGLGASMRTTGDNRIRKVFPGIDVELHGRQGVPEFDFLVSPRANPSVIAYTFGDDAVISLLPDGGLHIRKRGTAFTQRKPLAWQRIDGVDQPVAVAFQLAASGSIGFTLGRYRRDLPLVIDPTVEFSSNLAVDRDHAFRPIRMAKAPSGDFFILGHGDELSLPKAGPSFKPFPERTTSLVLARIDGRSYQLLSKTFLPIDTRYPNDLLLSVDSSGSVWVGMTVLTTLFPALNPPIAPFTDSPSRYRPTAFLMRFNAEASAITYSAYAGCQGALHANTLSTGAGNDLVLAGVTGCLDFPVSAGAYQPTRGGAQGFISYVMKLDSATGAVRFSSYFGGTNQVNAPNFRAVAAPDGRVLVAASASGNPFPVSAGAFQERNLGELSVYAGALSADGASLSFGSYFGSGNMILTDVFAGPGGSVSFSGLANRSQVPLSPGAFSLPAGNDAQHFIARISSDGKRLESSAIVHVGWEPIAATILPNGDSVFSALGAGGHAVWSDGAFSGAPGKATFGSLMLGRLSSDGTTLRFSSIYPSKGSMASGASLFLEAGKVVFAGKADSGVLRTADAWPGTGAAPSGASTNGFLVAIDFDSPTSCSYSVESDPRRFPNRTSSGQIHVTTQPGCPWIASPIELSLPEWPVPPGAIGTGSLPVKVPINLGRSDRTIEIAAGSTVFPLLQDAGTCDVFEVTPAEVAYKPNLNSAEVRILTPQGCTWNAGPSTAWFTEFSRFSYPQEFSGPYSFSALASQNSFEARSGVLPLGNRVLSITQEAGSCTSSVSPTSINAAKEGGEYNLQLQTVGSNCVWQAFGGPGARAWNNQSGIGSATVPIRVDANPGNTPRETYVILANKRIPILQSAGNCTASFANGELVAPHVGGRREVQFNATGEACEWNTASNASWLKFPFPRGGSGTLYIDVEPNLSPLPRTAVVRNLGARLTVTQLGNNDAYVLLSGPREWPIKINGNDVRLNYEGSFPIGTQLTLQPQPWRLESTSEISRITRWSDGATPNRTLTLSTNSKIVDLESEILRRAPMEKVNGGSVNLTMRGTPSDSFPEFYARDAATGYYYTAIAVADAGYRFVGWIQDPMNGYYANPHFPAYQLTGEPMRPRFERIEAPAGAYLVPESLEFVEYPLAPAINHYVELRGLSTTMEGFRLDAICPGGQRLYSGIGYYPLASDRVLLGFSPYQDQLLELGQGVHDCTLTVGYKESFARTIPMTIHIEGVPVKPIPPIDPPTSGIGAITNAATFTVGPISPGGLFTVFGTQLASGIDEAHSIPLPQLLKEAQIRIYSSADYVERYAGLLYVSPLQINFHVPEDLPIGDAEVRLYRKGILDSSHPVRVVKSAPGVFITPIYSSAPAPAGYGVLVSGNKQTKTEIYTCPPGQGACVFLPLNFGQAQDQLFLSIYATGLRNLKKSDIRVMANGVDLPVDYLGPHSYFVGLDQINIRIPRSLAGTGLTDIEMRTPTGTIGAGRVQF